MKFEKIVVCDLVERLAEVWKSKPDLILQSEAERKLLDEGKLEILDVYDENNQRIGAASRKAYIQLGLITRAVHIFLFNSKGLVYIQKRAENKDTYPGFFSPSAAGHVGLEEESKTAAERELFEELHVRSSLVFLGSFKCFKPENVVNQFYDFYMAVSDEKVEADKGEVESGEWVSLRFLAKQADWKKFVPALKWELELFASKMVEALKKQGIESAID